MRLWAHALNRRANGPMKPTASCAGLFRPTLIATELIFLSPSRAAGELIEWKMIPFSRTVIAFGQSPVADIDCIFPNVCFVEFIGSPGVSGKFT